MGSTPVLAGEAALEWDAAGGHEIVTVRGREQTQRIVLDGREHRWDVLESELQGGGKTIWKLRHKDFHDVQTAAGTVRLPGASLFEEGGDTVRIDWRDQRAGEPLDDAKFQFTPQPGLPECGARP
jgi:hypothetical protein